MVDDDTADFPAEDLPNDSRVGNSANAEPNARAAQAHDAEVPPRLTEPIGPFAAAVKSAVWQVPCSFETPIRVTDRIALTGIVAQTNHGGIVFSATSRSNRAEPATVVVKMIRRPDLPQADGQTATIDEMRARLRRESKAGLLLNGWKNFAEALDFFTVPDSVAERFDIVGPSAVVQQAITGPTLRQILEWVGNGRGDVVEHIAWQLLAALIPMRNNGIWHLDLKPANIAFLAGTLTPVILDFGGCHLESDAGEVTQFGRLAMTNRYAPYEQLTGTRPLSAASDIHTWAVTVAEFASCKRGPWTANFDQPGALTAANHGSVSYAGLCAGPLLDAVELGMARDPEAREQVWKLLPELYAEPPQRRPHASLYTMWAKQRAARSVDQGRGSGPVEVVPAPAPLRPAAAAPRDEPEFRVNYQIEQLQIDLVRVAARRAATRRVAAGKALLPPPPAQFTDIVKDRDLAYCTHPDCAEEVELRPPRPWPMSTSNKPLPEPALDNCPNGHEQLPGRRASRDVMVALVGEKGASKTTYLTVLFEAIVRRNALAVFGFRPWMPERWFREFEEKFWLPLFGDGKTFRPTEDTEDNVLGVRLLYKPDERLSINLWLVDVSGERLNSQMIRRAPHVGRSSGAIFLVEPESIGEEKPFPSGQPDWLQAVRSAPGVRPSPTFPVAVAVTKADQMASRVDQRLLANRPGLFASFEELLGDSMLAQDALEGLGGEPAREYMTVVENAFEPAAGDQGVTYHWIAPTGHSASDGKYHAVTPMRCLDPLLSVLYRKGRLPLAGTPLGDEPESG